MNVNSAASKNDPEINLLYRLQQSNVSTAQRTADQLGNGLSLLSHHLGRTKNSKWQGEAAWLLSGLKHNALDGLDIQRSLDVKSDVEHAHGSQGIRIASNTARQALFSKASPVAAAVAFQEHQGAFTAICIEILGQLKKLTEQDQEVVVDRNVSRRARATHTENQAPSKTGT